MDLYHHLNSYIDRHRSILLAEAEDPGTFFVKTVKQSSADASYNQTTFYEAWRLVIQRYGIYNPYTGRGAIKGLLPHGPHNVREVLATHILKLTGAHEQASYAIQDTPDMIQQHYGQFLPQGKAAARWGHNTGYDSSTSRPHKMPPGRLRTVFRYHICGINAVYGTWPWEIAWQTVNSVKQPNPSQSADWQSQPLRGADRKG
ncbi:hypothetical protein QO004_004986 [Rhizobium mesoamericanum]|nr:hypothetical protein [Rhizobium mesoamericanum]